MLFLLLGLAVAMYVFVIWSMCKVASDADDKMEEMLNKKTEK